MDKQFDSDNFNEQIQELVVDQARRLINFNSYTKSILSTLPVAMVATDRAGKVRSFNTTASKLLELREGSMLTDSFPNNISLQNKINNCLNHDESYTLNSQTILSRTKGENVVNIYLQPLFDDERENCGVLLAMEDQTYVSFLQESILRYASPSDQSKIIAETVLTKGLQKKIKEAAKHEEAILFAGNSGTGKTFFAGKLHQEYGFTANDPYIVIDCKSIHDQNPGSFIFGNAKNTISKDGEIVFRSVSDYGAIHLAQNGSLVLKNIEYLPLDAQEDLLRYLLRKETKFLHDLNARIILTTSINISELEPSAFSPDLANYLSNKTINVPLLWKRRKEIIPLAKLFLAESEKGKDKIFSPDSENLLLSRQYSYNNVRELKDAVELAAEVSADNEISSECIFIGPREDSSIWEFNISQLPFVKWLIRDEVLNYLRLLVLVIFVGIGILSILYTNTKTGSILNAVSWGIWWPGFIIFLLVGRLWCSVCPLSATAALSKKLLAFNRKTPTWIKNYSYLIIPLTLVIILVFEHTFDMVMNPAATGVLLLTLILLASIFSVLFEREVWCRYVCPLGGLGAIFTVGGILNVNANPDVCSSKCKTHECNKGSDSQPECPVFHHPLYAKENHVCKLCFNCLKSCPHHSAKLTLQLPLVKIWKQKELPGSLSVLALSVFFMAPLMLGTRFSDELAKNTTFTICALIAFSLAFFVGRLLSKTGNNVLAENESKLPRISFALLVLSWGVLAAYHFSMIPILNSLVIFGPEGTVWNTFVSASGVSLMKLLQTATILIAAIFGWITVLSLKEQFTSGKKQIVGILFLVFILYAALNIWMILTT